MRSRPEPSNQNVGALASLVRKRSPLYKNKGSCHYLATCGVEKEAKQEEGSSGKWHEPVTLGACDIRSLVPAKLKGEGWLLGSIFQAQ